MSGLSDKIKALRLEKGLTQKKLADALHVSQNAIYNWENGKREPSLEMIDKIATALGVSVLDIMNSGKRIDILSEENTRLKDVKIEVQDGMFSIDTTIISDQKLLSEFHLLNRIGQKEAITRVSELKYIPGYTGEDDIPFE